MSSWSRTSLMLSIAASLPTLATRSIVSPFICGPRKVEFQKAAVFLDQLPVGVEFSAVAQITDEIRVHARLVLAARLLVGASDGEVYRPAELLVEEDIGARLPDSVVGPDTQLAQVPRPGVGIEQAHQILLAPLCARVDDPTILEAEPGAGYLAAPDRGGHAEIDPPVGRVLDGAGEYLAARHVTPARRVDKRSSLDGERQVRLGSDDADLAGLLEPVLEPFLLP